MKPRLGRPWICAALLSALLCGGCSSPADNVRDDPPAESPAHRIVSLAPHLTELVYSAGAGERLVGVVEYSDFPPEAKRLPRIGDAFRVDMERLVRLKPDLVLAWSGGNPAELIGQIESLGFRVVDLTPNTLLDIADHVEVIGRLAGTSDTALEQADAFRKRLEQLRETHRNTEPVDVFYQISPRPIYTVSDQHPISQLITLCGGRNLFGSLGQLAPVVSREAVLAANPEVFLAGDDFADPFDSWRRWPTVRAVRLENFYRVDADVVARSSLRILDGGQQVCEALAAARLKRGRVSRTLRSPLPAVPEPAQ